MNPPRPGDIVYLSAAAVTLELRLLVYACIGDGYSTVALGNASSEAQEIVKLRPHSIVVASDIFEKLINDHQAFANGPGHARREPGWRRLAARLTRASRPDPERRAVVDALGGRARWISPTTSLDPALSARLSSAVTIGSVSAPAAHPA
jgi:hypothetical protein